MILNYQFNPLFRQVVFTDEAVVRHEGILLITNLTSNRVLYNFADQTLSGTVDGNVVTLAIDTTAMNTRDRLQIWYEDGVVAGDGDTSRALAAVLMELQRIRRGMEILIGESIEPGDTD